MLETIDLSRTLDKKTYAEWLPTLKANLALLQRRAFELLPGSPELYQDLVVRVAGFSEFFVRLTPELQQDIIARMEHR